MTSRLFGLFLIFILVFSFSSCGGNTGEYSLTPFEKEVTIEASNISYSGILKLSSPKDISLKISEPKRIEGILLTLKEGEKLITKEEVSITLPKKQEGAFALLEVLSSFSEEIHILPKSGIQNINFTLDSKEYKIIFSCDEERLLSIENESCKLVFK